MKKILLIIILAAFMGCGKKEDVDVKEAKKSEPKPKAVKYTVVKKESQKITRQFSASIKSEIESKLSFRVPGTINKKYVKLGDRVKKGQILATLDPIDYEVKYQSSLATLEQAKANLTKAQADFERYEKLYFSDNVSKADYDNAMAQFKSAEAQLDAANKKVQYDSLQLQYTKLVSPASGTIAQEASEENETISAGTPVYVLSIDGGLEVDFFVPESLVYQIKERDMLKITVGAIGEKVFQGEVKNVGKVSTGYGNTFPIKGVILNPSTELKSGMTAQIEIDFTLGTDEGAIILPLSSVVTDESGKKYVFVVSSIKENVGTVKQVFVTPGRVLNTGIEIADGLKGGEFVITAGTSKVVAGEKVEITPEGGR